MKKYLPFAALLALSACAGSSEDSVVSQLQVTQDIKTCKTTVKENLSSETTNAIFGYIVEGKNAKYDQLKAAGKIDKRMLDCLKSKGYGE